MPLAPQRWQALAPPAANVGLQLSIDGYDRTSYVDDGSLAVKVGVHGNSLGTLDVALNDPPVVPDTEAVVRLFVATSELFEGRVKDLEHTEFKGGHRFVKLAAQDGGSDLTLPTGAPWGLSDTPNGSTTHGYESMRKIIRTTEGGAAVTTLEVKLKESGLWANMLVALTSVVHGLAAVSYQVNEAALAWRNAKSPPEYTLICGAPIVSLAQLVTAVAAVGPGEITSTQISDGAISTPKLSANAVIANLVNVAGHVTIGDTGVAITGGSLSVTNPGGTVIIDGTSDIFRIAATGTLQVTAGANATVTATVSLGALSFAFTPALLSHVTNTAGVTADANPVYWGTHADSWVAATNGGVVNREGATSGVHAWWYNHMSGTTPVPTLILNNSGNAAGLTVYGRYYLLQQGAL